MTLSMPTFRPTTTAGTLLDLIKAVRMDMAPE
jgi:hypothetical protein